MIRKTAATSMSSNAHHDSQRRDDMSQTDQYLALLVLFLVTSQHSVSLLMTLSTRQKERESIITVSEGDCMQIHSLIPYRSASNLQTSNIIQDISQRKYNSFRGSVTIQAISNISLFLTKRTSSISATQVVNNF